MQGFREFDLLDCPTPAANSLQRGEVRLRFEGGGVQFADAAVGADDEGEGEGVPVFVGVGGDVGAVGAYGDPEFLGGS